jgi:hypothetical protein
MAGGKQGGHAQDEDKYSNKSMVIPGAVDPNKLSSPGTSLFARAYHLWRRGISTVIISKNITGV